MTKLNRPTRPSFTRVAVHPDYRLLLTLAIFVTIGCIGIVSTSVSQPADISESWETSEVSAEPDWEQRLSDWQDYYLPSFQQQHAIGKRVNVKLARGSTVSGSLMEVKRNAIVIGMDRGQATIKRERIHPAMRREFFADDYALSEAQLKVRSERREFRDMGVQTQMEKLLEDDVRALPRDTEVTESKPITEKFHERIAELSNQEWLPKAGLILLSAIWGLSPFFLYWRITQLRSRARNFPSVRRELKAVSLRNGVISRDLESMQTALAEHDNNVAALGQRVLLENFNAVRGDAPDADFESSKTSIESCVAFCEQHGFRVLGTMKKEILADLKASFNGTALGDSAIAEPEQELEVDPEQSQAVNCPNCDTSILASALLEGNNTCPHCQGVFVIDMG